MSLYGIVCVAQVEPPLTPEEVFDEKDARVVAWYNNEYQAHLEHWANKLYHPVDNRLAFTVKTKIYPALTQAEIDSIIELTADWFPAEP